MRNKTGGITASVIFLGIVAIAISQCESCGSSDYSSRSKTGYNDGYNDAKVEYQNSSYESGYNAAKEEYQTRIDKLVKDYEAKLKESYATGFSEGEISMQNKITEKIELDAKNKIRQGDWNAVLFDLKD